jgi:hypothetical protein
MPIHHVTYAMPNARNAQRKAIHMLQRSSHTPNSRNQTHTKLPPANEWKLLDLGVWWKYRLVGHEWVHGSWFFSLSLRCLSENDTSLPCALFWNVSLGSLQHLWPSAVTLKWDMGILLTKVTHGVCDPNELRATTSCGNILSLCSGLSNTQLFAGRPRHQRRTQKLAIPRSGLPIQPTPDKIRVWKNHEVPKKKTQSTKGRSRECDATTWKFTSMLADAKSSEMLENESTDILKTGCPASSPSSRVVTRSCFGTLSGPRAHLPHLHQEM